MDGTNTHAHPNHVHAGDAPVKFVHGRHDLLALPKHAEALARRIGAPLVSLPGGHLITRENASEVRLDT